MHERAAEFAERASEEYGVDVDVHEFDEGTKTAADAADAVGCDVAQIASSIVVVADGDPVVVVTSGANRVDLDTVAVYRDASDARMAEADEVKEATGWSIGGVPPFCHATDVPVLLDETLLDHDEVWAAAGTPTAVWPVDPERLRELAGAEPAAVAE
ncbi:YbaK/EbsC family protein [Halobacterium jilantaiense]|uniref:Cys-tRNA(Pro) deacylase, prolyl-tRNA editing enzyme YbaK/EbsC n=1 Tax=Halobacterium jilantaiense TaxID=355548 RepID=A0A1I0PBQ8_9EURY|nr:YbaK/EbsC family protein [Halobacterium jilantaiense]SEW11564.1 Cys-tRNA(Pro) deacylase, prolyl-tRNA editing enzyme YbaK/EbsC [Halobacterium jilantaiense]